MSAQLEAGLHPGGIIEYAFFWVISSQAVSIPSVKPLANTESCQAAHLQYHLSGRLHVVMEDGSEYDFIQGDVSLLPPGHDAWVMGEEPVVVLNISGMADYAKS